MAAPLQGEVDDDIFDSVIMAEQRFQMDGYAEGYADGCRQGVIKGKKTGVAMGTAIASEVGFYKGFVTGLKITMANCDQSSRKWKILSTFDELVSRFPLDDASYNDLHDDLGKMRSKFKQVASVFNFTSEYGNFDQTYAF